AAETARELGARELILVVPYLCYMRQDMAFQPGEAISQRSIGRWLGTHFDAVITVDPHLHRVHDLAEVIPSRQALSLSAAPLLGKYAARTFDNPLLLGPDEESTQWVAAAAQAGGLQRAVAHKQRRDDRSVIVTLPSIDVHDRSVVIVDDIASTGRTLARAADALYAAGAAEVHALVTHALFVGDAEAHLRAAGVRSLHSSDSIAHPSNAIVLAELLAHACKQIIL
ncbi:MAG: ribose-phosphate diphosphokinase, partial [Gammaproteobacteria bacterium]|nr:ribose-phosphate diphosphokinase [Gammaproteobacteria bacterium]